MKNIEKLLTIILFLNLFLPLSAIAQNKYSNEAINIYNSGVILQRQGHYELAKEKYKRALQLEPNFVEAKKNLIVAYQNLANNYLSNSDYEKSILACKQALDLDSDNNSSMHSLAQIYIKTNEFDKASEIYTKLLATNPNDKTAINNLEYLNYQNLEKKISNSINNLTIKSKAPEKLYKLIKAAPGVSPSAIENLKTILDLIWNEPNGQILLQNLITKKIPINITQEFSKANAQNITQKRTFYYMGIIPVFSWNTSSVSVNIPVRYIENFNNNKLSSHDRIYYFQVFLHEFCHAFMFSKNPKNVVSIEEELGASMIGYNIASKIITNEYLNQKQTIFYSQGCLQAIFSDEHRDLQIYNNFNQNIQNYGIKMPHPELYSNIIDLYEKLLAEKKINPISDFE